MKNNINVIIGKRGNLSTRLQKNLKNTYLISADDIFNNNIVTKNFEKKRINLIINSFYQSSKLNNIQNLDDYIKQSVIIITSTLNFFKKYKINKIIYTSSSSIYNFDKSIIYKTNHSSREFYALTKLICEKIIIKFSTHHKINYIIPRLFNVFGGEDNFSIISKIIKSFKSKKIFVLYNNGEAIRDFIHVDEVCRIYEKLLDKVENKTIDIGNGHGYKIHDILSILSHDKFKLKKKSAIEQKVSISESDIFKDLNLKVKSKLNLNNYLKKELKLSNNINLKKYYFNKKLNNTDKIFGSIIYGAGNAGKQVCNLILNKNEDGVFCFVDDNKKLIGKTYKGKKIISKDQLKKIASRTSIPNIIIAIPSIKNNELKNLFNELYTYASSVHNVPLKSEINTNKILLSDIQNSEFLNFFERNQLIKKKNIYKSLKNKNILVTGAGGSIGSELVLQLSRITKKKIICLDISEFFLFNLKNNVNFNKNRTKLVLGDINDQNLIKKLILREDIDIIFHAAAYKHLNFLEKNPIQAIKNNILGTYNLIESCLRTSRKKIKMINISTDKAVKPKSVLGMSKRIAEIICKNYEKKYSKYIDISTVRFGNVFASKGSAISVFLDKINNGEYIELTHKKVERYFMSVNEACNLVITSSLLPQKFKTFIFDMGKPVNLYELIKKMGQLKSLKDKNFELKVKEVGLYPGEKLKEELSMSNKFYPTSNKKIYYSLEPTYENGEINNLILNFKKYLKSYNETKVMLIMKKFLAKEI